MEKHLRVLMIEDSEDDSLLILRALKQGCYETSYKRVDNSEEMASALRDEEWDIILSDFSMPRFNGMAALKLLKKTGLDIPFIMVSGKIGEELAVEAMKAGAHDYVMKDKLSRLVPVIERELKEVETRIARLRAEEALRKSEERFKYISQVISDFAYSCLRRQRESYCTDWISSTVERITGYSAVEIMEWGYWEKMVCEEDLPAFHENVTGLLPNQSGMCELRIRHKDGNIRWLATYNMVISDPDNPSVHRLYGACQDITERKQNLERLRRALSGTVQAITMAVESKDPYTAGHQRRTADLARMIAMEMGFSPDRMDFVRIASVIHDIGKIAVPADILSKSTKLTDIEFNLIKTHSQAGYDILKDVDFPWPVAVVILQHHERMDGSGYPHGLEGDNILIESRILSIADVVEAIASHRPYRPAKGIDAALEEIVQNRGTIYDGDAVDACERIFREKVYKLII